MSAQQLPIIIIGAGLSGLATAWYLKKKGKKVTILEASDKIGGVIQTHKKEGFIFEQGPNTGILKYPEVVEMFEDLKDKCKLTIA
ncbi:MAG: oleate hydratase, partial [Bacteroidales bacterium]